MVHIFNHFPPEVICPICRTSRDEPCVLVAIAGTREGHNVQAQPTHKKCLDEADFVMDRKISIIYTRIESSLAADLLATAEKGKA